MAAVVGQALVDFSINGLFPEEDASSLILSPDKLQEAVQALASAKSTLEACPANHLRCFCRANSDGPQAEVHRINQETAEEVSAWFNNAKSLQDDISRSKILASDIVKQSEAPDTSGKAIREAQEKTAFLKKELNYNQQVQRALKGIRGVNQVLDQVEQASKERRVLDALHLLESTGLWLQTNNAKALLIPCQGRGPSWMPYPSANPAEL